jgi:hypothetical protein
MLAIVLTVTKGDFSAVYDGKAVHIYGGGGELLDTLPITVASEAELREVLTEWLRAS